MQTILLGLTIFASHADHLTKPYNWHMPCERWQERAAEIIEDDNLDYGSKRFLIRYLRSKVEGECNLL
tara:strand:+ start:4385 stop:4588 length:204 start_codon:yes stop_codon:yes gene_type:complete